MEATKDGRTWQIGTATEVAWIANATTVSRTITATIPPVFETYATSHELFDQPATVAVQERAVVQHLSDWSRDQPWWLGFLDTGSDPLRSEA